MLIERRKLIGFYVGGAALASCAAISGFMSQYSGEGARLNKEATLQVSGIKHVSQDILDRAERVVNDDIPDDYSPLDFDKAKEVIDQQLIYKRGLYDARQSNGAADQYAKDKKLMYWGIGGGAVIIVFNYTDKKFVRRRSGK